MNSVDAHSPVQAELVSEPLCRVLTMARWAPSGDNTQPWRFEVVSDSHLRVHGYDTRKHCVYDLDGHASHIAHGALLETLVLAATTEGLHAEIQRQPSSPDDAPVFDINFSKNKELQPDPLVAMIDKRVVQRRSMSTRPLEAAHREALSASIAGYRVIFFESLSQRWEVAKFMAANAKNRFTMPEAYPTHRDIIEWGVKFSEDRVPAPAVGVDPITSLLMRWTLRSWQRVHFLNYFGGALVPRIQLDLLPGLRCGAHVALVSEGEPKGIDDFVSAGRAFQRFWLTATSLGLFLQPEMTPVIFARYTREGRKFTTVRSIEKRAARLAFRLENWMGKEEVRHLVAMARLGYGPAPRSRSVRMPVPRLLERGKQ